MVVAVIKQITMRPRPILIPFLQWSLMQVCQLQSAVTCLFVPFRDYLTSSVFGRLTIKKKIRKIQNTKKWPETNSSDEAQLSPDPIVWGNGQLFNSFLILPSGWEPILDPSGNVLFQNRGLVAELQSIRIPTSAGASIVQHMNVSFFPPIMISHGNPPDLLWNPC